MIVVRTTVQIDPDRRERAMEYVTDLVAHAEREEGTVRYDAAADLTEPNLIRFFEQYEDVAALEAHVESEPYRRFNEALPELVVGEIETIQFETDGVRVSEFSATDAVDALD